MWISFEAKPWSGFCLEVKKQEESNGSITVHWGGGGEDVMRKCVCWGPCPSLGNVRMHSSYFRVELARVTIKLLPSENLINLFGWEP